MIIFSFIIFYPLVKNKSVMFLLGSSARLSPPSLTGNERPVSRKWNGNFHHPLHLSPHYQINKTDWTRLSSLSTNLRELDKCLDVPSLPFPVWPWGAHDRVRLLLCMEQRRYTLTNQEYKSKQCQCSYLVSSEAVKPINDEGWSRPSVWESSDRAVWSRLVHALFMIRVKEPRKKEDDSEWKGWNNIDKLIYFMSCFALFQKNEPDRR